MKTRFNMLLAVGGVAVLMGTGCVSSKKYKASQASLQQVRTDSAQLAQQVASLNQNVSSLESKNGDLQKSLESTNANYTAQGKKLGYYQDYFSTQQANMTQVSDQLKTALTSAGLSADGVTMENGVIYVNLDESQVFNKNTAMVNKNGQQAITNVANVVKDRTDVNIFVNDGDDSSPRVKMSADATATGWSADAAPRHRAHHRSSGMAKSSGKASGASASSSAVAANSSTNNGTKPAHKKVHHKYSSEGGMAFNNSPRSGKNGKAWGLKHGRMNSVAAGMLKNGVPKMHLTLQPPTENGQVSSNIKVVIRPTMSDFTPQTSSSTTNAAASTGTN